MRKRALFVTFSQALSSASNFLLIYLVSRRGSLEDVASVSLGLLVFSIGNALVRGACFRRLLIGDDESLQRPAVRSSLAIAVLLSTVAMFGLVLIGGSIEIVVCFVVLIPVLLLHDSLRQVALIREHLGELLGSDLVWFGLFVLSVAVGLPGDSAISLTVAWGVAGALSLVLLEPMKVRSDADAGLSGREYLSLVRSEVGEVLVLRFVPFLAVLAVASSVNIDDFGAWTGLRSFFGPLTVLYATMSSGGLLVLSRLATSAGWRKARSIAVLLIAAFLLLCMLVGIVLDQWFLQSPLGPAETAALAYKSFIWPVALFVGLAGVIQVLRSYSHALQISPTESLRTQSIASTIGAVGLLVGIPFGMYVAAWSAALGALLGATIWVRSANQLMTVATSDVLD